MNDRFTLCSRLAKAADANDAEEVFVAAGNLRAVHGIEAVREVFRFMHLFRGFPAMVRALGQAREVLSDAPPCPTSINCDHNTGQEFFEHLYGGDSKHVLPQLEKLDPLLSTWVIDHAYGRVLNREQFPLSERERLAVLLLSAGECWHQWMSHVRICLRIGVSRELLIKDTQELAWPAAARAHALNKLKELDD